MEWRKKKDGEWWLVFEDAPVALGGSDEKGALWPPSMTAHKASEWSCLHLHAYSNGAMPGEGDEDNVDYLHVCDLDELIAELQALRSTLDAEGVLKEDKP